MPTEPKNDTLDLDTALNTYNPRRKRNQSAAEPKKPHAKRRNYQRDLEDLKRYAEISIDVMSELTESAETATDYMRGQIAALKAVLARLERQ